MKKLRTTAALGICLIALSACQTKTANGNYPFCMSLVSVIALDYAHATGNQTDIDYLYSSDQCANMTVGMEYKVIEANVNGSIMTKLSLHGTYGWNTVFSLAEWF
jgi:hypothetical protein